MQTVTTNTDNGKGRAVLCITKKVHTSSLPRSLRHMSGEDALTDAVAIIELMRDTALAQEGRGNVFEGWHGMTLLLDLLQDKIEIAAGDYSFPFFGSGDADAPALVIREGAE